MDAYQLLGVEVGASPAQVRRAYATAVRRVHPDGGGPAADAPLRLAELTVARDTLLALATAPPRATPPPAVPLPGSLSRAVRAAAVVLGRASGHRRARRRPD